MKETTKLVINRVLSILTGVIAGALVIGIGEMIIHSFQPMQEGLDQSDPETLKNHLTNLPKSVFIGILFAHALGAFVAGFVASQMAKIQKKSAALFTGLILLLAGVLNLVSIPHPLWFSIADVLIYTPLAIIGYYAMNSIFNKNKV